MAERWKTFQHMHRSNFARAAREALLPVSLPPQPLTGREIESYALPPFLHRTGCTDKVAACLQHIHKAAVALSVRLLNACLRKRENMRDLRRKHRDGISKQALKEGAADCKAPDAGPGHTLNPLHTVNAARRNDRKLYRPYNSAHERIDIPCIAIGQEIQAAHAFQSSQISRTGHNLLDRPLQPAGMTNNLAWKGIIKNGRPGQYPDYLSRM